MQVSSLTDFKRFLTAHGYEEISLHELISTKDGLQLWTAEGFSWDAGFGLAKNSESNRILEDYFAKKDEI